MSEMTEEELQLEDLWDQYNKTEVVDMSLAKDAIPVSAVDDICDFLSTRSFTFNQLKLRILPVCIQYKVSHESFWNYLKKKRVGWS